MSTIEIIRYTPELKEELVAFRERSYETGFPECRDYLEWKYERNPYITEPLFYLARAEGRIVGMRGMYGTRWEYNGDRETVVLPCGDDFAIDPAFRNRGIVTLIMKAALDDLTRLGFDYVINTSGGRATVMSSLVTGWKPTISGEPLIRRSAGQKIRHHVRSRVWNIRGMWRLVRSPSANLVASREPFRRIDRMGRFPAVPAGAFITASHAPRTESMAELVARLPYDGRIRHVRDAAFFRWRFQTPIRKYRYFYYERDGQLQGYLILANCGECQLPTLPFIVVDWEGVDEGVREELLECVVRVAQIEELGTWAGGRSHTDRAILNRAGFVPTDFDLRKRGMPCFLVKKLRDTASSWMLGDATILDASRWDPRLIYTMLG